MNWWSHFFSRRSQNYIPPQERHQHQLERYYHREKRNRILSYVGLTLAILIPIIWFVQPNNRSAFATWFQPQGILEVQSPIEGLEFELFANETSLGNTPFSHQLKTGEWNILGTHPDFELQTQSIVVEKDRTVRLIILPEGAQTNEVSAETQVLYAVPRTSSASFREIDLSSWLEYVTPDSSYRFTYPDDATLEVVENNVLIRFSSLENGSDEQILEDGFILRGEVVQSTDPLQQVVSQQAASERDNPESPVVVEFPQPIKSGGRVGYRFQIDDATRTTLFYFPLSDFRHVKFELQSKDPRAQGYYNLAANIISSLKFSEYPQENYLDRNSVIRATYFSSSAVGFLHSSAPRNYQLRYYQTDGKFYADAPYPELLRNFQDRDLRTIFCTDEFDDATQVVRLTKGCIFEQGNSAVHFEVYDNTLQNTVQHFGLLTSSGTLQSFAPLPHRTANFRCHTALAIDSNNVFYYACSGGDENLTEASLFAVNLVTNRSEELVTCVTYKKVSDQNIPINALDSNRFQTQCVE